MQTIITIMRPAEAPRIDSVDIPEQPHYRLLRELIVPHLNGGDLEHVTVLHDGQRADMFVDEMSAVKGLSRNEAATEIYRNNWLTQHPDEEPESLPAIYGPAVLFSRRVWF